MNSHGTKKTWWNGRTLNKRVLLSLLWVILFRGGPFFCPFLLFCHKCFTFVTEWRRVCLITSIIQPITNTMKSQVCKIAYHILKTTNLSQSEAMKKAWATVKVREAMKTNDCVFFMYLKANGEIRSANGTLLRCHLPHSKTKSSKTKPVTFISYFDLDCMSWRAFMAERILAA